MSLGGSGGGGGQASSSAIKAGEAFIEISANDSKLTSTLNGIGEKIKRVGGYLKGAGAAMMVAGAAILLPLAKLFDDAFRHAAVLDKVADRMQTTTEAVTRLGYAASLSDANMSDLERSSAALAKSTLLANKGSKEQVHAFKLMGISANEFAKLGIDQKILRIAESADTLSNQTDRNRFLFALLGKSAIRLLPLLKGGAEGIRAMYEEAERVGEVLSSEDAANATTVIDSYDRSMKAIKFTLLEVGASFLSFNGSIKESSYLVLTFLKGIRDWIKENRTLVAIVAAVGAAVFAVGAALFALGIILPAIVAGFTSLVAIGGTVLAVVFSPLILKIALITAVVVALVAAIAGLVYAFVKFTSAGQMVSQTFSNIWSSFKTAWGGIVAALVKGDLALAGQIAFTGLKLAWAETVASLTKTWIGFKGIFVDGWYALVAGLKMAFVGFGEYLETLLLSAIKGLLMAAKGVMDELGLESTTLQSALDRVDAERTRSLKEYQNKTKPISDEFDRAQAERDKFRNEQISSAQAEIDRLKAELARLVEQTSRQTKNAASGIEGDENRIADKIATAVRGTFRSADYRGAFALGPAVSEAKKQTQLQENILDRLEGIEDKIGMAEFD